MRDIEALHENIRKCTRCISCGYPISLPPIAGGVAPAPFMLIGQAPSVSDLRNHAMYTGPAGRRLIGWLKIAGFTDEDFGSAVYLTAITKCFPGRPIGKSTDRAPTAKERSNCRPWLDAQIQIVNPQVVILFGKMAINAFLPGATLDEAVGGEIVKDGIIYIPLPHSSGASTWLNDPAREQLLQQAISIIRERRIAIMPTVPLK